MPNKKVSRVRVKTLKEKFKDKSFARGIDRNKIRKCEEIGCSLEEFFDLSLSAIQKVAGDLGL
jgi:predicted hydrolase (HD superfamily)